MAPLHARGMLCDVYHVLPTIVWIDCLCDMASLWQGHRNYRNILNQTAEGRQHDPNSKATVLEGGGLDKALLARPKSQSIKAQSWRDQVKKNFGDTFQGGVAEK
jgi:hypothetical protein